MQYASCPLKGNYPNQVGPRASGSYDLSSTNQLQNELRRLYPQDKPSNCLTYNFELLGLAIIAKHINPFHT